LSFFFFWFMSPEFFQVSHIPPLFATSFQLRQDLLIICGRAGKECISDDLIRPELTIQCCFSLTYVGARDPHSSYHVAHSRLIRSKGSMYRDHSAAKLKKTSVLFSNADNLCNCGAKLISYREGKVPRTSSWYRTVLSHLSHYVDKLSN
jgi:hypothetical protein